jgi:two-component system response regulator PilR (NtrC family)
MNSVAHKILVVDDEIDLLDLLDMTLSRMGHNVYTAADLDQAKRRLEEGVDMCITDMRLPDGDGIDLVRYIQTEYPHIPVAVITAHGNMELAITAMKAGAYDFVSKPVQLEKLRDLVKAGIDLVEEPGLTPTAERAIGQILGSSDEMVRLRERIKRVGRSQAAVFIAGESGTGKELVARAIHESSPRREHPFVVVNCGAMPQDLIERELFGFQEGKLGLLQQAQGGTLFLDDVIELPLHIQAKLLRFLQDLNSPLIEKEADIPSVRLMSACENDLQDAVQRGEFGQDLFYLLNVIDVFIPPLRDHREDIPELGQILLERFCQQNKIQIKGFHDDALNTLKHYSFPGNMRELENIIQRAVAMSDDILIKQQDLRLSAWSSTAVTRTEDNKPIEFSESYTIEDYLEDIERTLVREALEKNKWNKTAAAKFLGISFRQMRYRLKKLQIE